MYVFIRCLHDFLDMRGVKTFLGSGCRSHLLPCSQHVPLFAEELRFEEEESNAALTKGLRVIIMYLCLSEIQIIYRRQQRRRVRLW